MNNRDDKTNGLLIGMFLYVLVFGIKVDNVPGAIESASQKCEPITTLVIKEPPDMPVIKKEYLDNKTYVIRVLVNHISSLNEHITNNTKQTTEIYNTYKKCIVQ